MSALRSPPLPGSRRSPERAVNAPAIAAALSERAEAVCRQYLPHGRRQGRYWVAGDLDGARGRSLYVRLAGPGTPGKWTDAATGEHGDLLDLIRHRSARADASRGARRGPRLPRPAGCAGRGREHGGYDATEAARRLWRRCRAVDGTHAERYLQRPGSRALPLRGACAFTPSFATAKARPCAACRRWSPP